MKKQLNGISGQPTLATMSEPRTRPRNLGVLHMRLPIVSWVSIFHRVTGVLLVAALPGLLYLLSLSLESAEDFARIASWLARLPVRLGIVALVWLFAQHFLSGVRHLLLDLDIGIGRRAGRFSAAAVFLVNLFLTLWVAFAL